MEHGEYRVFGPPGTGKTHYLARQVAKAVQTTSPQKIVVVSFTKAAAEEIASRVKGGSGVRVGTLHSFCYKAVEAGNIADSPKWLKKWNKEVSGEPSLILKTTGADPLAGDSGGKSLEQTFLLRARMIPLEEWTSYQREAYDKWCEWKSKEDLKDFTDLIEECLRDIDTMPGEPEIGFFDEVQDFSTLELALVRKWGQHMRQVILAGDDDQSIYGFKGATPNAFLQPDVSAERKLFLRKSYRLPSVIKKYADRWISQVKEREIKEYQTLKEGGEVRYSSQLSYKNPRTTMNQVLDEVKAGNNVMVLATCRYMLNPLCRCLETEGVVFHNPYQREDRWWNPLNPCKGAARSVLSYLRPHAGTWDTPRLWTWSELNDWIGVLDTKRFKLRKGMKGEIKRKGKDGTTAGVVLTEAEMLNVLNTEDTDVVELFLESVEAGNLQWFKEHIAHRHMTRAMQMALRVVYRTSSGAELRREPKITLGTIHSVKGGQCDTVFVFPDLSGVGYTKWNRDRDSITRLFYVALTRASKRVVLCGPQTNQCVQWI